ncbi:DNA translocase FtsK [uncultured Clostridium sp.]|uniref:FtsK/SpoIIIE family DNA translocase n=1 Tax=uncultured Clostridium sp. TaxID=59620 RepID=UPI00261E33B2|nr:DNA translocase FtsK [uncultured Clostridium sp.]
MSKKRVNTKGRTSTNTKKSPKKSSEKVKNTSNKSGDIKGIIIIAIGLILSLAIYTNLIGSLSKFSQSIVQFLVGIGGYAIPVYILYLGYEYIRGKGRIKINKNFIGITIYLILFILISSTIYIHDLKEVTFTSGFNEVATNKGAINGGILGYIVSYPMYKLLGAIGSYIIYFAFVLIGSILVFDITLYDLGIKVKEKSKSLNKLREDKFAEEHGFIDVVNEGEVENKRIKTDDSKLKTLKFMQNSSLHNEEPDDYEEFEEKKKEEQKKPKEKEAVEPKRKAVPRIHEPMIEKSKGKDVNGDEKEEIHNAIENSLLENKKTKDEKEYIRPSLDLLKINKDTELNGSDRQDLIKSANKLTSTLMSFGVEAEVNQVTKGPSVTRFELQPSPGVKVSKIVNLADDIALGLAASGVRIEAPIPGKSAIGIEVPNKTQTPVFLREVLESEDFTKTDKKLAIALGKDIGGECVVGDLSKMPHTLIAGATGSGKSVCINTLIVSLLYKYSPDEVKLLMVDPKVVELSVYNGIPHLLIPVVTEPKKAAAALNWAVNEMTRRYKLFADSGARNIDSYNQLFNKGVIQEKLPYIVIIVDELADLMMVCANDVEDYIGRLAQMARAAGMHLVIATQRPSVDVITGVIKANIPSRISFAVSSQIDSRTILDSSGAEKLLGKGDMLYYPVGESKPLRVQGCFISEEEVENLVNFVKKDISDIKYEEDILEHIQKETKNAESSSNGEEVDELLGDVIKTVIEFNQASTSFIQRKFKVGFNRASRIMDELEERGIISGRDGSKPRQVLVSKEEYFSEELEEIE